MKSRCLKELSAFQYVAVVNNCNLENVLHKVYDNLITVTKELSKLRRTFFAILLKGKMPIVKCFPLGIAVSCKTYTFG